MVLRRLVGLCAVLAWSGLARAGDTTPVRIAIEVPEGCSSVRSFYDAVRARTDRIHLTTRAREGLELRVIVVRLQARYRGELRVVELDGARTTRSVEGTSCEEVVRALSLTAALVVGLAPLVAGVVGLALGRGRRAGRGRRRGRGRGLTPCARAGRSRGRAARLGATR